MTITVVVVTVTSFSFTKFKIRKEVVSDIVHIRKQKSIGLAQRCIEYRNPILRAW